MKPSWFHLLNHICHNDVKDPIRSSYIINLMLKDESLEIFDKIVCIITKESLAFILDSN